MRKGTSKKRPQNSEEIQIGCLAHAYRLSARTINTMIMALGARFDASILNIEELNSIKRKNNIRDYKLLHNDILIFFNKYDHNTKKYVFEAICSQAYLCGSQVDYEKRLMQLALLYEKEWMQLTICNSKKDESVDGDSWHRDDIEPREMFPSLSKPAFCSDHEYDKENIDELIRKKYIETVSVAIRDLSYIKLDDAIVFLENNGIQMIDENDAITYRKRNEIIEQYLNKKIPYNSIVRAAWVAAIEEYKNKHRLRKNDKVPKYIEILLKRLDGIFYSDLVEEYTPKNKEINLTDKLRIAWDECVPIMLSKFPELPPLPKI